MNASPPPNAGALALTLGERITVLRKRRKLSQAELARRAKLDRTTVSDFEGDKHVPALETLHRLARALETDVASLLGEESTVML